MAKRVAPSSRETKLKKKKSGGTVAERRKEASKHRKNS